VITEACVRHPEVFALMRDQIAVLEKRKITPTPNTSKSKKKLR
jgi:hypothetical protein